MKAKTVYECSDGTQFESKVEAKKHEKFLKYQEEVDSYGPHFVQSMKDADINTKNPKEVSAFLAEYLRENAKELSLALKNYYQNKK